MSERHMLEPIRKDPDINQSPTSAYYDKDPFKYINMDRYRNMVIDRKPVSKFDNSKNRDKSISQKSRKSSIKVSISDDESEDLAEKIGSQFPNVVKNEKSYEYHNQYANNDLGFNTTNSRNSDRSFIVKTQTTRTRTVTNRSKNVGKRKLMNSERNKPKVMTDDEVFDMTEIDELFNELQRRQPKDDDLYDEDGGYIEEMEKANANLRDRISDMISTIKTTLTKVKVKLNSFP